MKLKALDQVHVSAVKSDSLRPGEEFVVSDSVGEELLKAHPGKFQKLGDAQPEAKPESAPINVAARAKAQPAPPNKAEGAAPANKAGTRRKRK